MARKEVEPWGQREQRKADALDRADERGAGGRAELRAQDGREVPKIVVQCLPM